MGRIENRFLIGRRTNKFEKPWSRAYSFSHAMAQAHKILLKFNSIDERTEVLWKAG